MKMKSKAVFVSGAVVALMIMGLLIANRAVSAATSQPIAAAVVAQHSTASDCWFIISGKVYDVTSYIPYHPGGQGSIVSYCGRDATAAFGGIGHSSNAQAMLQGYYIGDLATAPPVNETQPPVNATPPFNYTGHHKRESDDHEYDEDEDDDQDDEGGEGGEGNRDDRDSNRHNKLSRHRESRHAEDDDENDDDEGFQLQRQRHSGAGRESRSLARREED